MASVGIFEQWRESLTFFRKDQLKTFFLLSLNTTRRALVSVGQAFPLSWLVLFVLAVGLMNVLWVGCLAAGKGTLLYKAVKPLVTVAQMLTTMLVVTLSILATRSSTERKDFTYYQQYLPKLLLFLTFMFPLLLRPVPDFLCDMSLTLRGCWQAFKNGLKFWWQQLPVMVALWFFYALVGGLFKYFLPKLLLLLVPASDCSLATWGGWAHVVMVTGVYVLIVPALFIIHYFFASAGYSVLYDRIKFSQHERFFQ